MRNNNPKISTVESEARRRVCWDMANNNALDLRVHELFLNSRQWKGYDKAFNSWERAIWKLADSGVSPRLKSNWRQYLQKNRHLFPPEQNVAFNVNDFDLERGFQTYLLRRKIFLGRAANRKKNEPAWWKRHAFILFLAAQLNDDDVFKRLVQLNKSDMPTGKRALSDWLLVNWVPGCFWAFTNNGISARITQLSDTKYSEGSIKNTISTLKLWRPVKPLYWGLTKDNQLVSLR